MPLPFTPSSATALHSAGMTHTRHAHISVLVSSSLRRLLIIILIWIIHIWVLLAYIAHGARSEPGSTDLLVCFVGDAIEALILGSAIIPFIILVSTLWLLITAAVNGITISGMVERVLLKVTMRPRYKLWCTILLLLVGLIINGHTTIRIDSIVILAMILMIIHPMLLLPVWLILTIIWQIVILVGIVILIL